MWQDDSSSRFSPLVDRDLLPAQVVDDHSRVAYVGARDGETEEILKYAVGWSPTTATRKAGAQRQRQLYDTGNAEPDAAIEIDHV